MDEQVFKSGIIPILKDEEVMRITVLTNICRMMITRGHMDKKKYSLLDEPNDDLDDDLDDESDVNRNIDDTKFLKLIEKRNDTNTYKIHLDTPFKNESGKHDSEFDGSVLIVKIIPQKITDTANSVLFNDTLKTYANNHKLIVFDSISYKAYKNLKKKKNTEIFEKDDLMIDFMAYECAPVSCELIDQEDIGYIINGKIAKLCENDPMARYYNVKKGGIVRIVRRSLNNCRELGYRRVIDSKPVFK